MIDLNLCKKKCGVAASLKIVGTELNIQILAIEGDTVFDWYDINRDVTHIFHDLSLYSVKVIITEYGGGWNKNSIRKYLN